MAIPSTTSMLGAGAFGRQQGKSDFLRQIQTMDYAQIEARIAAQFARNSSLAELGGQKFRCDPSDIYITPSEGQKVYIDQKCVYTGPTTLAALDKMPAREWLQAKTDEWLGG